MPARPASHVRQRINKGDRMLKRLLRNLILGEKADSEKYVAFLRNKGVQIGENVRIFSPTKCVIDTTCPWLLKIGDNVNITHGVIVLTHDYSWSVLKMNPNNPGRVLGSQSPTTIGNNVFIGMNAVVTCGVTIGNNVIIGAGSVVTADCENDSVYAGVPAKKIMTVDEFYQKREACQLEEAKTMVRVYCERFGTPPPKEELHEYFMLFSDADEACKVPRFRRQLGDKQCFDDSVSYMKKNKPMFACYEDFLSYCIHEK